MTNDERDIHHKLKIPQHAEKIGNAHLRRKAYTATAAKMARTIKAVVKHGEPYRSFFEGVSPNGRTLV